MTGSPHHSMMIRCTAELSRKGEILSLEKTGWKMPEDDRHAPKAPWHRFKLSQHLLRLICSSTNKTYLYSKLFSLWHVTSLDWILYPYLPINTCITKVKLAQLHFNHIIWKPGDIKILFLICYFHIPRSLIISPECNNIFRV